MDGSGYQNANVTSNLGDLRIGANHNSGVTTLHHDGEIDEVDESDFIANEHKLIYRGIKKLIDLGSEIDTVTLIESLSNDSDLLSLSNFDRVSYVKNLVSETPGTANFVKNRIPGVRQLPDIPSLPQFNNQALQGFRTAGSFAPIAGGLGKIGKLRNLGKAGLSVRGAQVGFTGMGKKGFDAIRSGDKFRAGTMKVFGRTLPKPQILGSGAYSAPTRVGAQRYAGATGSLGGRLTPGGVLNTIVPGGARRIGMIESQAAVKPATFDKGLRLADKIGTGQYGRSALANRLRGQMATGVAPGGGFGLKDAINIYVIFCWS